MATKPTPTVETPIEPEAVTETPTVETLIEPEAVTETAAVETTIEPEAEPPFPDPVASAEPGALTPVGLAKLRQLVEVIEANRFAPFEQLARALHDSEGMEMSEDGPHTICTMASVTAVCAGDGRAALFTWCNAARRYLLRAGA